MSSDIAVLFIGMSHLGIGICTFSAASKKAEENEKSSIDKQLETAKLQADYHNLLRFVDSQPVFESESGQKEFEEWKSKQAERDNAPKAD
jgi:hypothetical protein